MTFLTAVTKRRNALDNYYSEKGKFFNTKKNERFTYFISFQNFKKYITVLFLLISILLFNNCGKTTEKIVKRSAFDTSDYHIQIGNKLLNKYSNETNQNKKDYYLKKAEQEIIRAKVLAEDEGTEENYKLYNSLGLLSYYKKDYEEAIKNFKLSQNSNKTNIKSYMLLGKLYYKAKHGKDWQKKAEKNLFQTTARKPGNVEANFLLGKLNYEKLDFKNAKNYLSKTIKLEKAKNNLHYTASSKKILNNIKILSKLPVRNPIAKYIGTKDTINHSEFAYLIVNELLNNNLPKPGKNKKINDLPDNLYKDSIIKAVNIGILELAQNSQFLPKKEITRIQFARAILNIHLLKTGDRNFGSQYSAVKSTMKDIRGSNPSFVPIMFALENKFFQLDKDRNFNPHKKVSGLEALKIINSTKELLKLTMNK